MKKVTSYIWDWIKLGIVTFVVWKVFQVATWTLYYYLQNTGG